MNITTLLWINLGLQVVVLVCLSAVISSINRLITVLRLMSEVQVQRDLERAIERWKKRS